MDEEEFEPRLGRIRAGGSRRGRKYLHQVLAATARAGAPRRKAVRRFEGSRLGRGATAGRLLGSRDRFRGLRARRAIIKTRLVRLAGKGFAAARAHLRYIQRDGVSREGERGQLYSAGEDAADGRAFLERCAGDRHQFRFIVSAEDGCEYDDLRPLVRRFMARMEEDLGTRLDWVAADHRDTGHPHSHIMLRGKDDRGENLVIAREYIARGMRERLAELVTLDLGPRTDLEIARKLRIEVDAERLTELDRRLVRDAGLGRELSAAHRDPFEQALRAGRLKKLEALGLAEDLGGGRWRLDDPLAERLRAFGERGDIIRTMQRALGEAGIERSPAERVVHRADSLATPVVGRVVARGLSDELADRHYLIIDGIDGRVHHVDVGAGDALEPLPEGAIVRVSRAEARVRPIDRTVAEIAATNDRRYSVELHLRQDPSASEAFVETHVRRLEALRRGGGGVERLADGSWKVAPDHLERVAAFEEAKVLRRPVRVEIVSPLPLQQLVAAEGATWLDRELVSGEPEPVRDSGFGKEVRSALALRRQWLVGEGLAIEEAGEVTYRGDMLAVLRRRELLRVAAGLSDELAVPYSEVEHGARIAGRLERRVDLASGPFALIANAREFSLVPWRDSLERHIGRELDVRVGASGISWTIGRGRSGPEIG